MNHLDQGDWEPSSQDMWVVLAAVVIVAIIISLLKYQAKNGESTKKDGFMPNQHPPFSLMIRTR